MTIHSYDSLTFTPKHSSILPPFVVPPSPADACCVYLPACWLYVRMAVGMNDCMYRYRVVQLRGILNLSLLSVCLSIEQNQVSSSSAFLTSQWVCLVVSQIFPQFVTSRWKAVSMLSCLPPTTPPAFLVFLSGLVLSCLDAFPPQQVIPEIKTLLIVAV